MSNEVITHKHKWVRGLFSELEHIAKDAATMADENQPLLGSEHCFKQTLRLDKVNQTLNLFGSEVGVVPLSKTDEQ